MTLVQVQFAIDDIEVAESMVARLLEERLVACAQILGPMTSRYRWRGELQTAQEWLVILKTREFLSDKVMRAVEERHPYETPEVLCLLVSASDSYRDWVFEETDG